MVLTVIGSMATTWRAPQARAAVLVTPNDPMMSVPRGTPEKVIRFAQENKSTNFAETRAYIYEVYRLAPLVGLDPSLVIAQSAHETANWTSFYWTEHLNPAGIGIGYSGAPSYTWASGTNAARFHLVRLYIYVAGALDPGNPLYPYREDGPSYQRVIDLKYNGQVHVLNDLTGKWATDPNYGRNVANRGNLIYAPDAGDPSEPALQPLSVSASAGNNPYRTRDSDLNTTWAVSGVDTPPPGAYVVYDFGEPVVLQNIQWVFRKAGYADAYHLQISSDGANWTDVAQYEDPTAWTWQIYQGSVTTNYIRLLFDNPNDDMIIGYLGEVEFYGHYLNRAPAATSTPYPPPTATNTPIPTATNTPTATPTTGIVSPTATTTPMPTATPAQLAGKRLPIVRSGGSGIGNWSGYVWDGNLRTTWQTTATAPRRAQVYVDLGRRGTITGTEFVFRRISGARYYTIRVSDDKKTWTPVAIFTYADPLVWQRASFNATGRYVQFLFTNTNGTSTLGYLAEVKVYGYPDSFSASSEPPTATPTSAATATATLVEPSVTITETATATATEMPPEATATQVEIIDPVPTATSIVDLTGSPVPLDDSLPIDELRRTANSTSATALVDGDVTTTWESTSAEANKISVIADLGTTSSVGAVEWLPGPNGITGELSVEVQAEDGSWDVIGQPPLNPAADLDWQTLPVNRQTGAIRIVISNSGAAQIIGGIAELRVRQPDEP